MAGEAFPVEYAVLGLLAQGPRHGYRLKKEIERDLRPIWRIATSRLYLALSRLEGRGLIRGDPRPSGGRARRVYRLTPAGREALWEWLRRPVPAPRDLRVEFLAKLYFLRRLSPEEIPALIRAEIRALMALRDGLLRDEAPPMDTTMWEYIREFRLGQIEAALGWLEHLAERLPQEVKG